MAVSEEKVLIAGVLEVADTDTLVEEIVRRTASFIPKLIPHMCCFTCTEFRGNEDGGRCPLAEVKVNALEPTECHYHVRKKEYHYYWSYGDDGEKDELVGVPNPAFDQSFLDRLWDLCADKFCQDCDERVKLPIHLR